MLRFVTVLWYCFVNIVNYLQFIHCNYFKRRVFFTLALMVVSSEALKHS